MVPQGNQEENPGGNPGGNPGRNSGRNPCGNPGENPGGFQGGDLNALYQRPQLLFSTNPYMGDINPNSSEGQKLYMQATAKIPDDDRFDISIKNGRNFLDKMNRDTNQFGWGSLI